MTTRTITLTGRPPVTIDEDTWPVLAEARESVHDGEVRSQANEESSWVAKVRQHADGRAIVYGVYQHDTAWRGRQNIDIREGAMLDAGCTPQEICDTIRAVCDDIADREHAGDDAKRWQTLAADCIADMPAEELV